MTDESLTLGAEFPTPNLDEWKALVEKSLNGAPFDKKMLTSTFEGFALQPLYTREDEGKTPVTEGLPGFAPFTRGARADGNAPYGWEICQVVDHPDPVEANRQALAELTAGATGLSLHFDGIVGLGFDFTDPQIEAFDGSDGVFATTAADLEAVLEGVHLDAIAVRLKADVAFEAAALTLAALWEKKGVSSSKARGAFNADPIGARAFGGPEVMGSERALNRLGKLAAYTAKTWPNVTTAMVDGSIYHGAGGSESQTIGCMLSTGVAYLRAMEAAGLSIDDAARQIVFNVPMDADQFLGIAKLRALRRLWGKVLEACNVNADQRRMTISAGTATRMLTERDPWVNMLRTTVSTFSSVVGGADIITVAPFDAALGLPTDFSRRIARNIQILLMEESNLGRVIDPAGGSWAVESLTEQLAGTAWAEFQKIEADGGIVAGLDSGRIEDALDGVWEQRRKAVATRRQPITGVNEFPNLNEAPVETEQVDGEALQQAAAERAAIARKKTEKLLAALDGETSTPEDVLEAICKGAPLGAVTRALADGSTDDFKVGIWGHGLAEDYERLRDNADAWKDATGAFPAIFMVTLGPVAEHTGRATFARNLFEAGGIEALSKGPLDSPQDAVAAWKERGTRAVIICGSDERYADLAEPVAEALKAAGCDRLYLAGKPSEDVKSTWESAGIDAYVYMGCPVYDVLADLQSYLGVFEADDEGEE